MSFGQRESCTSAWLLFVPCGMSEEQEQSVCIKFCVKLERNGAETFEMLRTAFVEQCLIRARISNGTRGLKKAETQLMTIRGLADRRQAKLTTVLRECEN